jgi:hypothetical protein
MLYSAFGTVYAEGRGTAISRNILNDLRLLALSIYIGNGRDHDASELR